MKRFVESRDLPANLPVFPRAVRRELHRVHHEVLITLEEQMTRTRFGRLWFVAAAFAAIVPSTPVIAAPNNEAPGIKDLLCAAAQCFNGERKCADLKAEIKNPTGTGNISVTYYCYEKGFGSSGDDSII
jgi:hypothetical protein